MLSEDIKEIPLDNKNIKKFIIEVDDNLCSINILYDLNEDFELENLFLIIKSYILSKEILIKDVRIVGTSLDFSKNIIKPNFFRNISITKLEKFNFFDFVLFYEEMIENDKNFYMDTSYTFYGFSIVIMKESEIWKNKKFYPIFPWANNFKNNFILKVKNIKEINRLKKENSILKRKLKYSLYRDARRK